MHVHSVGFEIWILVGVKRAVDFVLGSGGVGGFYFPWKMFYSVAFRGDSRGRLYSAQGVHERWCGKLLGRAGRCGLGGYGKG